MTGNGPSRASHSAPLDGYHSASYRGAWYVCDDPNCDHECPAIRRGIAEAVATSKAQILADIASGRVPADVADFGTLHDFVDANEYGGLCDEDGPLAWFDLIEDVTQEPDGAASLKVQGSAEVQLRVHDWLVAGRPTSEGN